VSAVEDEEDMLWEGVRSRSWQNKGADSIRECSPPTFNFATIKQCWNSEV
jgi:hypothetical protein